MSTPLPAPGTLLDALDALERQLALLEDGRAPLRFQQASADGLVRAVADGLGRLVSVSIDLSLAGTAPTTLAAKVQDVVNAALAAAIAATASAISAAAAGFALPGLPAQGQAPPGFANFASMLGTVTSGIIANEPCNSTTVFQCVDGPVTATVSGQRQVLTLVYASPLPRFLSHLELSTVAAVNCAAGKATDRPNGTDGAGGTLIDSGGSTFQNLVIYAAGELLIDDRVQIVDQTGAGFGRIANAGVVQTNIGVTADVGNIVSQAKVVVRDRGRVHGSISTAADLQTQNNTEIAGPVSQHALVLLPDLLLNVAFTGTPLPAISLEPDKQASAGPGYYTEIVVKSRSTLTLTGTGVYRCNNFQLEPQSVVVLASGAPTFIYARDNFIYRGRIDDKAGGFPNLFVGHFGISQTTVEAPFRGTIVAPFAKIQLATVGTAGHAGAFHGKDVEVFPDAKITHHPFSVLYDDLPGIATPSTLRARLFTFEDPAGWTSLQAVTLTRVSNPTPTAGKLALQIANIGGRTEIVSPPFPTAGITAPTRKLRVDLWIPSNQPKPTAVGQVQIFASVASAGVSNVLLGSVQLTPLPRNAWSTLEVTMTQAVTTAITGDHPDGALRIVLDVTAGSGPYLLDNLRFA